MTAYYNENDPFAAAWLRELIAASLIAPGHVDERSIEDVTPEELLGYKQHHFFAGIGVWSYALRLAGWPDNRPIWTASCPCQPFSAAGKSGGFDDERHLWPAFHHLLREYSNIVSAPTVIGEQVASKAAEPWIDLVQSDMEALGYAFGCVPFPSAGVGAPHIRDRAYWLAYPNGLLQQGQRRTEQEGIAEHSKSGGMADNKGERRNGQQDTSGQNGRACIETGGDTGGAGPTNGHWRSADWIHCRDGKWRPVEPGTFPLVDGAAARVGRLCGYGNAINAEAAQAFIETIMELQ